jgi:V8-like Glu-specific endopeptidase
MSEQSFADQLLHCTTRIECTLPGNVKSTGSGFFFNFKIGEQNVPTIVTNKHVIANAIQGKLRFTVCDKDWQIIPKKFHDVNITEFEKAWILHPEEDVDLAIMPTQSLHLQFDTEEAKLFRRSFNKDLIASLDQLHDLTAIEDVIMAGYPNGIWDETNNLPLIRRGITATAAYNDYNGKKEFMVDMACFPGSSGSPVLLYNAGMYQAKGRGTVVGTRIYLLGVLYAGPQHTTEGELEIVDIPTTQTLRSISRIPNNLGLVIKAEKLNDFEPILEELVNKEKK